MWSGSMPTMTTSLWLASGWPPAPRMAARAGQVRVVPNRWPVARSGWSDAGVHCTRQPWPVWTRWIEPSYVHVSRPPSGILAEKLASALLPCRLTPVAWKLATGAGRVGVGRPDPAAGRTVGSRLARRRDDAGVVRVAGLRRRTGHRRYGR